MSVAVIGINGKDFSKKYNGNPIKGLLDKVNFYAKILDLDSAVLLI